MILKNITVLAVLAITVEAQVQVFPRNLPGFQAASGGPPVAVSFDAIAPGTDLTGISFQGVTFQGPGAPLIVVRAADTVTPPGFAGAPNPASNALPATSGAHVLSPGGAVLGPGPNPAVEDDDLTLVFSPPVAAMGIDHLSQSADGFPLTSVTVRNALGQVLHASVVAISNLGGGGAPAGADFWGVVSASADIASVSFDEQDGNSQYPDCNIGFDTLRFVPPGGGAPETWMLGSGCGAFGPGTPVLSVGLPVLGAPVTMSITTASALTAGVLFVSGPPAASIPLGSGCEAWIDLATVLVLAPVQTDANGDWSLTLALPPDPGAAGVPVILQALLVPTFGPLSADITNAILAILGT